MRDTLCLIPAKGCSTRLPKKNLLPLGGEPLIARIIYKAKTANVFAHICVSTESDEIATVAKASGGDVPFLRPENLSHDPSTIVDVALHALAFYESEKKVRFKQVCVLLPTTPFVEVDDIKMALELYMTSDEKTLLSVSRTEFPPFNAWVVESRENENVLAPCFPDSPFRHTKSTECPVTYRSNGAVLIVDVENLKRNKSYHSSAIIPYEMPASKSLDIDTEADYQYAKFLYESEMFKSE